MVRHLDVNFLRHLFVEDASTQPLPHFPSANNVLIMLLTKIFTRFPTWSCRSLRRTVG